MPMSSQARRAMREREREVERLRVDLEDRVLSDIRDGLLQEEIAAARKITINRVRMIAKRLTAEGRLPSRYKPGGSPAEFCPEREDARASEFLRRLQVQYRDIRSGGVDNMVAAFRNGFAARAAVYGGSVAGACADIGQPVR